MENLGGIMEDLKKNIEFFVKKIEYIIPVILTSILSFGFVITHHSINIDTLSSDRYYREGTILAQNRYGGVLLDKLFGVMDYQPFFVDCLAVIFLIIASITFCMLFRRISNNKMNIVSYTIFSCLFISYPLINEIFVYTPMSLGVCFSFFVIAIVLNLLYSYMKDKKISKLVYVSIIMTLFLSIYESSATVYLCGVFVIEILDYIYNNRNKKLLNTIKEIFMMLIPLIVSIALTFIISKVIINICDLSDIANVADKKIIYEELGIIEGIKNLIKTCFYSYGINGLFYLPITVMQIAVVIMLILGIIYSLKQRNITILLLFIGCICSIIILSIVQGKATPYRTCQVFQIFSATAFMLCTQFLINSNKNKLIKNVFICLSFLIIFYQAKDLNKYFYMNYVRYEQEKIELISIAEKLENEYDINNKSVVFWGNKYNPSKYIIDNVYIKTSTIQAKIANAIVSKVDTENYKYSDKYEYIYKPVESNINSYLTWGTFAFNEYGTEIFKWLSLLGYDDFKQITTEQEEEIKEKINNGDILLDGKTIIEEDEYIIVLVDRRS